MKIILIKESQLAIKNKIKSQCDFCGRDDVFCFESSFDDTIDLRKCNFQICEDCVKQLNKFL